MHPVTADGRYFVIKGQLWRCSNPAIFEEERQHLVQDLMEAWRAGQEAKASSDEDKLHAARAAMDEAKVVQGEGARVWRSDSSLSTTATRQSPQSMLVGTVHHFSTKQVTIRAG